MPHISMTYTSYERPRTGAGGGVGVGVLLDAGLCRCSVLKSDGIPNFIADMDSHLESHSPAKRNHCEMAMGFICDI